MSKENQNLLIERYARGREDSLIESYIKEGPTELSYQLGLSDDEWRVIFDYLVFEHNLLYKTVTQASDFFGETYIDHGVSHVRDVLDISDPKYDVAFEVVFDFFAISKEGLYYHVLQNRDRYLMAFKARGGDFLRKVLVIWKPKYDENWERILDLMLNAVCDCLFSDQTLEHGLRGFMAMLNVMREHRPIIEAEFVRPNPV